MPDARPPSLPLPAGTWNVDPAHAGVGFVIRHLGLTNVRGRFDRFDESPVEAVEAAAHVGQAEMADDEPDTGMGGIDVPRSGGEGEAGGAGIGHRPRSSGHPGKHYNPESGE